MPGEISRSHGGQIAGIPPWCVFLFKIRYDHIVPNGYVHHMTEYVGARDERMAVDELKRGMPWGRTYWKLEILEIKKMGPYGSLTEYCCKCDAYVGESLPRDGVCDSCRVESEP